MLRTLPPPWNVDAVLHVRALRGETLDRKGRQDARSKLLDWYNKELAKQDQLAGSARGGEEAKRRMSARAMAWKLKSSPLVEACPKDTIEIVRECVYNV